MKYNLALVSLNENHKQSKVECIKAVRGFTGLGLRDSKQIVDHLLYGAKPIKIRPDLRDHEFNTYLEMGNNGGLNIIPSFPNDPVRKNIKEQLTGLVTYTTIASQYDISKALIKILEDYFPETEPELEDENENENESE